MKKTRTCNLLLGIWMFTPAGKRVDALALAHNALSMMIRLAWHGRYLDAIWPDEDAPMAWPKSLVVLEGDVSIPPWLMRKGPLPTLSPNWLAARAWLFAPRLDIETYCPRCGPRLPRTIVDTSKVAHAWPEDLERDAGALRAVMAAARMITPPDATCHLALGTIWAERMWNRVERVYADANLVQRESAPGKPRRS